MTDRWQLPWIEGQPKGLDPLLDGEPLAWIALAVSLVALGLIIFFSRKDGDEE